MKNLKEFDEKNEFYTTDEVVVLNDNERDCLISDSDIEPNQALKDLLK